MLRCFYMTCYDPEEEVWITFATEESARMHELAVHQGVTTVWDTADESVGPRDPFKLDRPHLRRVREARA